jgi:hypothetical protein
MKRAMGSSKWFFLVVTAIFVFGWGAVDAQAGDATVTLRILNAPNDQGEIIIAQGDPGERGPQGIEGEVGPQGPQGEPGEPAPAGTQLNPKQIGPLRWYEINALVFDGVKIWAGQEDGTLWAIILSAEPEAIEIEDVTGSVSIK